jgi:hypothetical protein
MLAALVPSVGTNDTPNSVWFASGRHQRLRLAKGEPMQVRAPQWPSLIYVSEDKSDMRGIKHGWYAIEEYGALSSGPFPNFEECSGKIAQPANRTIASKSQREPN